ncbi:MAG: hypothetical protein JO051_16980 [Acidobacteriaceae bacterium]|nr:hypothetical protein [Acidobacteriaceae bacterium]
MGPKIAGVFGAFLLLSASIALRAQNAMGEMNVAGMSLMSDMSGTAVNPDAWTMPMIMKPIGSWTTMFMGEAFLVETQQAGPRGGDKLYSTNWLMANAEHRLGKEGSIEFQLMLSLEPATITERRYPLLFQTGETAFGKPIEDGQHPHNFVMGLGVQYALALSENTTLELYAAPVGDPALGPIAYPHRASAAELPQAPIAHHWQDSTHIVDDVVTAGVASKKIKLEASGFHGAEPNESRWTIEVGPIDSWAARLWFFPTNRWAAQVSVGRLTHPEALEPGDQVRATASVEYSKPIAGGSWSTSFIWGRDHSTFTRRNLNSYTAESVLPVKRKNFITGRAELVDKDELFEYVPEVNGSFRVGAYTIGYTRDIGSFRNVETGIGANLETYSLPGAIKPYYGEHPVGGNIYFRFRLKPGA